MASDLGFAPSCLEDFGLAGVSIDYFLVRMGLNYSRATWRNTWLETSPEKGCKRKPAQTQASVGSRLCVKGDLQNGGSLFGFFLSQTQKGYSSSQESKPTDLKHDCNPVPSKCLGALTFLEDTLFGVGVTGNQKGQLRISEADFARPHLAPK